MNSKTRVIHDINGSCSLKDLLMREDTFSTEIPLSETSTAQVVYALQKLEQEEQL